jgi:hypothetical protein
LIFKTIIMMYSIGNILVTIAAPTTNDASITQYEPNDAVPDNTTAAFTPDDANDDDVNLSIGDVLGPLEGTALKCCSRAGREKVALTAIAPLLRGARPTEERGHAG